MEQMKKQKKLSPGLIKRHIAESAPIFAEEGDISYMQAAGADDVILLIKIENNSHRTK